MQYGDDDDGQKKSAISFVNGLAGVLGFTSNADSMYYYLIN